MVVTAAAMAAVTMTGLGPTVTEGEAVRAAATRQVVRDARRVPATTPSPHRRAWVKVSGQSGEQLLPVAATCRLAVKALNVLEVPALVGLVQAAPGPTRA